MKNKVLVKVDFPELDISYDGFIPVNEIMWKINKLLLKSIADLSNTPINIQAKEYVLLNKKTGKLYGNNEIVINTDIRNGTELLMVPNSEVGVENL